MVAHGPDDPAEGVGAVAHALADRTRRGILRLCRDEERSAGELAAAFPSISRPAVSQHLGVLQRAGLVAMRPHGNRRLYRSQLDALAPVSSFIDEMWAQRLPELKRAAEAAARVTTDRTTTAAPNDRARR